MVWASLPPSLTARSDGGLPFAPPYHIRGSGISNCHGPKLPGESLPRQRCLCPWTSSRVHHPTVDLPSLAVGCVIISPRPAAITAALRASIRPRSRRLSSAGFPAPSRRRTLSLIADRSNQLSTTANLPTEHKALEGADIMGAVRGSTRPLAPPFNFPRNTRKG